MSPDATIHLQKNFFTETEKILAKYSGLTASIFIFDTGVHAVRLKNQVGEITVLSFQGQQLWDARFYGRTLTIKSMFTRPYPTQQYHASRY